MRVGKKVPPHVGLVVVLLALEKRCRTAVKPPVADSLLVEHFLVAVPAAEIKHHKNLQYQVNYKCKAHFKRLTKTRINNRATGLTPTDLVITYVQYSHRTQSVLVRQPYSLLITLKCSNWRNTRVMISCSVHVA